MPLLAIIIGAILLVTAIQNTYRQFFSDLAQDVPGFTKWAVAFIVVGMLQYIPGFAPIGRAFLLLTIGAFLATNRAAIIAGFQQVGSSTGSVTASPEAAQAFAPVAQALAADPTKVSLTQTDAYGIAAPPGMAFGGGATKTPAFNSSVGGGTIGAGPFALPALPDFSAMLRGDNAAH